MTFLKKKIELKIIFKWPSISFAGMSYLFGVDRVSTKYYLCEKTLIREVIWNPGSAFMAFPYELGDWYEYVVISRH